MKDKDNKKKAAPAPKKGAAPKTAKSAPAAKAAAKVEKPMAAKAVKGNPAPAGKGAPAAGVSAKGTKGAAPAPAPVAPLVPEKGKKGKAGAVGKGKAPAGLKAGKGHADARDLCREVACESSATSSGYCRLHYIENWKRIKRKELLLKEGKLNRYIEELVAKYPEKYIEAIRQDLSSDQDFAKVVTDLELDEGIDEFDSDSENIESLIDSIRKDMDDESDIY